MRASQISAFLMILAAAPARAYVVGQDWNVSGALSMGWRTLGPRHAASEVEIENQMALSSLYFGLEGPGFSGVPLRLMFTLGEGGQPELHQAVVAYKSWRRRSLELGKFVVPFGRYNQLYRPGDYLTVTHPLLYADPRNLDAVLRLNGPRPLLSAGYSDLGLHYVQYFRTAPPYLPDKVHLFLVNGFGESAERGQAAPQSRELGIQPDSPNGVDRDWEHRNQQLRDNNDSKAPGLRLEYSLGDFRVPLPLPEGRREIQGVQLGLSAMGSRYDIRDELGYKLGGVDAAFQAGDFSVTSELGYGWSQFRSPVITSSTTISSTSFITVDLPRRHEANWGYYVQGAFPIHQPSFLGQWRLPGRLIGVLGYNWMQRRGPELERLNAEKLPSRRFLVNGVEFFQINALTGRRIVRNMEKYTFAINDRVTDFLSIKLEFSTWVIQAGRDLTQLALAAVLQF